MRKYCSIRYLVSRIFSVSGAFRCPILRISAVNLLLVSMVSAILSPVEDVFLAFFMAGDLKYRVLKNPAMDGVALWQSKRLVTFRYTWKTLAPNGGLKVNWEACAIVAKNKLYYK